MLRTDDPKKAFDDAKKRGLTGKELKPYRQAMSYASAEAVMSLEASAGLEKAPHHPASFINAIAEEGTKAEAIEWLQKIWNELCERNKNTGLLIQMPVSLDKAARFIAGIHEVDNWEDFKVEASACAKAWGLPYVD